MRKWRTVVKPGRSSLPKKVSERSGMNDVPGALNFQWCNIQKNDLFVKNKMRFCKNGTKIDSAAVMPASVFRFIYSTLAMS